MSAGRTLSLRGCIPRLFPLGSLALPPPSGDPDAAWELQGRVFAALAAVVHAKRGGALRPVPLPPCPRSATARRKPCWGAFARYYNHSVGRRAPS